MVENGCWQVLVVENTQLATKIAVGRSGQVVVVDDCQKWVLAVVDEWERLVLARKRVLVALVSVYWYCLCFRMLCLSCKLLLYLISMIISLCGGSGSLGSSKKGRLLQLGSEMYVLANQKTKFRRKQIAEKQKVGMPLLSPDGTG